MAFNSANLTLTQRIDHANGQSKVFEYTTSDSKNDTLGSSYFSDSRFFSGGDLIEVSYSGGSYVGVWTTASSGLAEV